jgi:hypothetical protein
MRRRMETGAPCLEGYLRGGGIGHQKTGIDPGGVRFREMNRRLKQK